MKMKFMVGAIPVCLLVFGSNAVLARKSSPARSQEKKAPASNQTNAVSPESGCAILTLATLQKVLGQPFNGDRTLATKMPPAYDGPWGSSCQFFSQKPKSQGGIRVDFVVFTEPSAPVAKKTFDKVAMFFADRSKPRPSVGDEAYWGVGTEPTIHVLKGKVHYSVSVDPVSAKQAQDLAAALAAQL